MSADRTKFFLAVRKLALGPILAEASVLRERTANLCFVKIVLDPRRPVAGRGPRRSGGVAVVVESVGHRADGAVARIGVRTTVRGGWNRQSAEMSCVVHGIGSRWWGEAVMKLRIMRRRHWDDPVVDRENRKLMGVQHGRCIERGGLRRQVQRLRRDRIHRELLL